VAENSLCGATKGPLFHRPQTLGAFIFFFSLVFSDLEEQHRAKIDADLRGLFPPTYTAPRYSTCAVVGSAGV
jgi:hypothetical protein